MGAFFVDAMIQPVNLNKQRYATIISGEAVKKCCYFVLI